MVTITGSKSIFNKAAINRIIFEGSTATIDFSEGYQDPVTGEFVAVGADHIVLTQEQSQSLIENASTSEVGLEYAETLLTELTAARYSVAETPQEEV